MLEISLKNSLPAPEEAETFLSSPLHPATFSTALDTRVVPPVQPRRFLDKAAGCWPAPHLLLLLQCPG